QPHSARLAEPWHPSSPSANRATPPKNRGQSPLPEPPLHRHRLPLLLRHLPKQVHLQHLVAAHVQRLPCPLFQPVDDRLHPRLGRFRARVEVHAHCDSQNRRRLLVHLPLAALHQWGRVFELRGDRLLQRQKRRGVQLPIRPHRPRRQQRERKHHH